MTWIICPLILAIIWHFHLEFVHFVLFHESSFLLSPSRWISAESQRSYFFKQIFCEGCNVIPNISCFIFGNVRCTFINLRRVWSNCVCLHIGLIKSIELDPIPGTGSESRRARRAGDLLPALVRDSASTDYRWIRCQRVLLTTHLAFRCQLNARVLMNLIVFRTLSHSLRDVLLKHFRKCWVWWNEQIYNCIVFLYLEYYPMQVFFCL